MLVVGPASCMAPVVDSLCVLMTSTLLLTESNASTVLRLGDMAMRPGELPAPIPGARGIVSVSPLTTTSEGEAVGLAALCEASTRVDVVLGGP